jgi:hypothetical protein
LATASEQALRVSFSFDRDHFDLTPAVTDSDFDSAQPQRRHSELAASGMSFRTRRQVMRCHSEPGAKPGEEPASVLAHNKKATTHVVAFLSLSA